MIRHDGDLMPLPFRALTELEARRFVMEIATPEQQGILQREQQYLEAAHAYRAVGDGAAALANVTRVLPDHPRYREACVLAITLAGEEDRLSLALENFLGRFLRGAPETDAETPALDVLA